MRLEREWRRPVSNEKSRAFFDVMNLLARPQFDGAELASLSQLLQRPDWQPLAMPSLHREVLPLMRSNAEAAGISFSHVFEASESLLPTSTHCARACFARRLRLNEIAGILNNVGIEKAVLIKGAALASLLSNPALRLMSDIDILVSADDLPLARQAMQRDGWSLLSSRTAALRHSSGWTLDLQVSASHLGEAIYSTAESVDGGHLLLPKPELHAALIAIHCFQGHGERVWRDIADYRALKSSCEWKREDAARALELARLDNRGAEVEAFGEFAARLDGASESDMHEDVRARLLLLSIMGREQTSEILLHLIRQSRRSYSSILGGLASRLRPARKSAERKPATPRGLYDLPRNERLLLGCKVLMAGAVSREARRLMGVGALQSKLQAGPVFRSPGEECGNAS